MADARTLLKMRLLLSVRGYAVDAVIVCPYPIGAGMVFTYGHDTAGTDCVVGGRFISHVLEVVDNGGTIITPFWRIPAICSLVCL